MRVEFTVPKAFTALWSLWPGVALGLIFAATASIALADPAETRTGGQELTCRAPAGEQIRVSVETQVVANTPCRSIRLKEGNGAVPGHSHAFQ